MALDTLFFYFTLFFLVFLNIQDGNAQQGLLEVERQARLANKFSPKEMQLAKPVLNIVSDFVLKQVFAPSNSSEKTSECEKALEKLVLNPSRSFLYFDAAGKLPAGLLRGNLAWLGSFETCQAISDAHYCLLAIDVTFKQLRNMTLPLQIALCLPDVCGPVDLYKLFANITELNKGVKQARFKYKGANCPEKPKYTPDVIATMVFCGFLLLLCLFGTIVDVFELKSCSPGLFAFRKPSPNIYVETNSSIQSDEAPLHTAGASLRPYQKSTTDMSALLVSNSPKLSSASKMGGAFMEILRCFSLLSNTTKIFSTDVPPTAITSINGIRVISMFWIILGHTYLVLILSGLTSNVQDMFDDTNNISMMVIINGFNSVDSFFFLSGLLVAYTCFRKLEKAEGRFNWFLFYFHRYVRLTPSLMFVILFYVKLKPFLVYSPTWTAKEETACPKYWWTNLLYINNFYPAKFDAECRYADMNIGASLIHASPALFHSFLLGPVVRKCVGWTWYLANDMQFYIISPLILVLAHRFGLVGLAASAGSLLMASTVTIASISAGYNIDPMANSKFDTSDNAFDSSKDDFSSMIYSKPYCRIQPYLIGMMLGYFMHKSYSGTRKPGWIVALIAWFAAIATGVTLVYAPYDDTTKEGPHWNKAQRLIYGMFSRAAWGVALAWVVYACHYGLGGLVQRFLSARFWIPLSRLTYSAYLVHVIVLMFMFGGSDVNLYYSYATVTYNFIAAVVLAYACAFILAVVIEFPCSNLENFALNSLRRKNREN